MGRAGAVPAAHASPPRQTTRTSPLAKAQARIAELEALVEELLVDDVIALATEKHLAGKLRAKRRQIAC